MLLRPSANHAKRHPLRRRHDGNAVFDDSRFVLRDACQGSAAHIGMLQCHIRNGTGDRFDNIRRIQKAAESYLNHRVIDLLLGKVQERRRRQYLKLRRAFLSPVNHFFRCVPCPRKRSGEIFVGNILAVHSHSFII